MLAREWIVTAAHCVHRYLRALPCPASEAMYICCYLRPGCLLAYGKRHAVFLLGYRQLQASSWLVFTGIITRASVRQEDGVSVKKIIYHPLYNDHSLDYDIALMKLQVPLNFSGKLLLCPPPTCGGVCLIPQLRDGQTPAFSEPAISEKLFKAIQPGTCSSVMF